VQVQLARGPGDAAGVHLVAGLLAPLCIATFFIATLLTEMFGAPAAVAQL
jgi:hypothetical protein